MLFINSSLTVHTKLHEGYTFKNTIKEDVFVLKIYLRLTGLGKLYEREY